MNINTILSFVFFLPLLISCGGKKEEQVNTDTVKAITKPALLVCLGRVEPEFKIVKLSSDVSGIVSKVLFQAGDTVRKGQVIVELAHPVEDAQVQYNRAQYATRESDLATIKASLEGATIKMENLKVRYHRIQGSVDKGADTKQNLDNSAAEYQTSQKEVERIQASLISAEKQLNEISSQTILNQAQVLRKFVKAPSDGQLLTMDLAPGAAVQAMGGVADFAPKGPVSVLAEVDELFADQVKKGSKVNIRLQGQTDVVAEGEIIFASPFLKRKSLFSEGGDMEDRRVREVRIRLSKTGNLLFGSRVECVIFN